MKRLIIAALGLALAVGLSSSAWAERPDLNRLPPAERQALVNLINAWLDDEDNVMWHMNVDHNLARGVNPNDGRLGFFNGHQTYIRRLETFLVANGGQRFVPLPKWDPSNPIPPEFDFVKPGPGRGPLGNLNPRLPLPADFRGPAICRFATNQQLLIALRGWHDRVHGVVGGSMGDMMTAPAAPIFFCWHAFTDDVYANWLRCHGGGSRDHRSGGEFSRGSGYGSCWYGTTGCAAPRSGGRCPDGPGHSGQAHDSHCGFGHDDGNYCGCGHDHGRDSSGGNGHGSHGM